MKIIKNFLSKFLAFIILINSIFYGVYFTSFASTTSSGLNLSWQKTLLLNDTLNTYTRASSSDEVFLTWNFKTNSSGTEISTGTYELTYNIDNNKQVKFSVEKKNNYAEVTYSINTSTSTTGDNYSNTVVETDGYQVYKTETGNYITPSNDTYPAYSDNFKIHYEEDGSAKEVKFSITQNNGFSFKYKNNTVRFKWGSDGLFYFSTNGVNKGNIYDFNLVLKENNEVKESDSLKIFTGINPSTLEVTPKANEGDDTIYQIFRPILEYPADNPEIEVKFDMPKVWDETTKTYVFENISTDVKSMQVVFNLGNTDASRQIQVTINNIYKDYSSSNSNSTTELFAYCSSTSASVKATRNGTESVTLTISNLEHSTIYNPVTISTGRDDVETVALDIDLGVFYTYLKYSVVSLGTSEFYLKIEPFKGYNGYYVVKDGNTSDTLSTWATYEENNYGKNSILIPINLSAINPQTKYFQVEFSLTPPDDSSVSTNKVFKSQILIYRPSEADVILGTPTNLEVSDTSVLYNITNQTTELITTLNWDMAYSNVLERLVKNNSNNPVEVIYNFTKGATPTTSTEQEFVQIKATISLVDGAINIKIEELGETNYLEASEILESEVVTGDSILTVISPSLTFRFPVSSSTENSTYFVSPSINFISIGGSYTIGSETINISSSNSVNITIDEVLNISVPSPQDIKTDNISEQSFDVTFSTMNWGTTSDILYTYRTKFLEKIGLTLGDNSVKYSFYVAQSKDLLDNLIKSEDNEDLIKTFDYNFSTLSDFNFTSTSLDSKTAREWLRDGYIVEIKNVLQNDFQSELQSMSLTGLDKNQIYYVVAKAYVTPYEKDSLTKNDKYTEESSFSTIISATTLVDEEAPSESEKQPSAPTNFTKENVTLSSANLIWDVVEETSTSSTLEYQFIRLKGELLDNEFLYSTNSYEDTWNSIDETSKYGFRTSDYSLQTYSESSNSFVSASQNELEYVKMVGLQRNILDKTLEPNQIYYYYIRTVRVVDGKDVAYSNWVPLSLTSGKISVPTDLTVLRSEIKDKTSEIVISFKTPVMTIDAFKENYIPQYSIKKDNDSWSEDYNIDLNKATLVQNEDGTITVTYTITGLEHNNLYTIRVRLYNTNSAVSSEYSNEVTHRTNTDNTQIEYDDTVNEWEQNYYTLLEQFVNQDYWFITNNLTTTRVLYRPGHMVNIINSSTSSIIELEAGLGGVKREYYIPASEIEQLVNANKGIKITFGDSEVVLSSASLNFTDNTALTSMLEAINNGYAKDYFVKISVTFNEGNYSVDGSTNVSPSINVCLDFVGTSKSITTWDSYMLEVLKDLLLNEDFIDDLDSKILELVKNSAQDTELLKAVKDKLNSLISSFGSKLYSQIEGITRRVYSAQSLNGNIIIAHLVSSQTSATGYVLENYIWKSVPTSTYGAKKAIYTTELGTYIFAGSTLVISGIGNIENGSLITQIIVKYSLEDYLGKDGTINLNSTLSRNSAIGIAARISGATVGQDAVTFFSNKGVTLSNRNLDSNITTQEAIFLLMKAYEYKTNTNIETVKITNYNLTSNITGLSNTYKKAVQVAFQTGIYTNQNMSANGSITVKEFLQSLANLIIKVGL